MSDGALSAAAPADAALSEATMLASLRDIRLPSTAEGGLFADLLVSAGLAAVLAVAILTLFSARRVVIQPDTAAQSLDTISRLPTDQRRIALLRLLQEKAPERYAEVSKQLYKPDGLELSALEAEVSRLV